MKEDSWFSAMRRGDFDAAWRINDRDLAQRLARGLSCRHWPRHLQFVWDGSPLTGRRVLVHCYHGLGDTLQFARFAAPLRHIARRVVLWAQPQLVPLMKTVAGVDDAVALHDGKPELERDVDVEIMELGHALRASPQSVCASVPYVHVAPEYGAVPTRSRRDSDAGHIANPVQPESPVRRVGVCWNAGSWDQSRSLAAADIAAISRVPGIEWYSLQFPTDPAVLAVLRAHDLACRDIVELARRMHSLDLVISVDTMVAHLAGAMGLSVWTLLPTPGDWRWMDHRTDCPWYPTMRLFRQRRTGDWGTVIDEVMRELAPAR